MVDNNIEQRLSALEEEYKKYKQETEKRLEKLEKLLEIKIAEPPTTELVIPPEVQPATEPMEKPVHVERSKDTEPVIPPEVQPAAEPMEKPVHLELPKDIKSLELKIGSRWFQRIGVTVFIIAFLILLREVVGESDLGKVLVATAFGMAFLVLGEYFYRMHEIKWYGNALSLAGFIILYLADFSAYFTYSLIELDTFIILLWVLSISTLILSYRYKSIYITVEAQVMFFYLALFMLGIGKIDGWIAVILMLLFGGLYNLLASVYKSDTYYRYMVIISYASAVILFLGHKVEFGSLSILLVAYTLIPLYAYIKGEKKLILYSILASYVSLSILSVFMDMEINELIAVILMLLFGGLYNTIASIYKSDTYYRSMVVLSYTTILFLSRQVEFGSLSILLVAYTLLPLYAYNKGEKKLIQYSILASYVSLSILSVFTFISEIYCVSLLVFLLVYSAYFVREHELELPRDMQYDFTYLLVIVSAIALIA
ncbi:MAG: hypothetical protein ACE5J9_05710, partial [Methanosarcinales archaeon]